MPEKENICITNISHAWIQFNDLSLKLLSAWKIYPKKTKDLRFISLWEQFLFLSTPHHLSKRHRRFLSHLEYEDCQSNIQLYQQQHVPHDQQPEHLGSFLPYQLSLLGMVPRLPVKEDLQVSFSLVQLILPHIFFKIISQH